MNKYILLCRLTPEGRKNLKSSSGSSSEVREIVKRTGASVIDSFVTLGPYDYVYIIESVDNETITQFSVEISSGGELEVLTLVALPVESLIESLRRSRKINEEKNSKI